MENSEIIKEIQRSENQLKEKNEIHEGQKFVIFLIAEKYFALAENLVQEIIINSEIYYLPFVPQYIRGLINRQGDPYTVVDIHLLINNEKLDGKKFIILRDKIDKIAFLITDVLKIVFIEKDNIHTILSSNAKDNYFAQFISLEKEEIPVLDTRQIIKKIHHDIEYE
ncbi:MAG: hypothetical protein A2Y41_11740 [Spirochaetes bacterium GWB1_36_13]|nr:MAG: hypothetical protein A2Y41_11740 [Spirochaetes bacterium GWB1_36_13]